MYATEISAQTMDVHRAPACYDIRIAFQSQ
jgi:hypothetical protein